MGMRPDGMERWGVVAILKEAGRLLYCKHNYRRLFLPFYLAFYLPVSLVGIFQIVFLSPSAPPFPYGASFFMRTIPVDDHQGGVATDTAVTSTVVSITLSVVAFAIGALGLGAVAYIVAYVYSNEESDSRPDGGSIVKKVLKKLPLAFLRMWVTQLWTYLLMFVLYLFSLMLGGLLFAILTWATGRPNPLLILLSLIPFVVGVLFLVIMFAFAQFIAVLEPANYGREALKRSAKLVKTGRAGTVVAVLLINFTVGVIFVFPTQRIASGRLPVWEEIVLGAFLAVVNSAFSVYVAVVLVVMYFVYTARFNAAISSLPEFNTASPANPYKPLVQLGNAIGEP